MCTTVCSPMDLCPPGSSVYVISQARILEWVAISYSRGSSPPMDQTHISASPALAGGFFTTEPPGKPRFIELIWSRNTLFPCFVALLTHSSSTFKDSKHIVLLIHLFFKQIFTEQVLCVIQWRNSGAKPRTVQTTARHLNLGRLHSRGGDGYLY